MESFKPVRSSLLLFQCGSTWQHFPPKETHQKVATWLKLSYLNLFSVTWCDGSSQSYRLWKTIFTNAPFYQHKGSSADSSLFVNKAPLCVLLLRTKWPDRSQVKLQLIAITKALFLWYRCSLIIKKTPESGSGRNPGEGLVHRVVGLQQNKARLTLCLLMETSGGRIMHISDAPLFSPLLSGLNVNICPPRGTNELQDCAESPPFRWFIWSL